MSEEERESGVVGGKMGVGAAREVDSQVERRQMGGKRKLETSSADCINRSEPPPGMLQCTTVLLQY